MDSAPAPTNILADVAAPKVVQRTVLALGPLWLGQGWARLGPWALGPLGPGTAWAHCLASGEGPAWALTRLGPQLGFGPGPAWALGLACARALLEPWCWLGNLAWGPAWAQGLPWARAQLGPQAWLGFFATHRPNTNLSEALPPGPPASVYRIAFGAHSLKAPLRPLPPFSPPMFHPPYAAPHPSQPPSPPHVTALTPHTSRAQRCWCTIQFARRVTVWLFSDGRGRGSCQVSSHDAACVEIFKQQLNDYHGAEGLLILFIGSKLFRRCSAYCTCFER